MAPAISTMAIAAAVMAAAIAAPTTAGPLARPATAPVADFCPLVNVAAVASIGGLSASGYRTCRTIRQPLLDGGVLSTWLPEAGSDLAHTVEISDLNDDYYAVPGSAPKGVHSSVYGSYYTDPEFKRMRPIFRALRAGGRSYRAVTYPPPGKEERLIVVNWTGPIWMTSRGAGAVRRWDIRIVIPHRTSTSQAFRFAVSVIAATHRA